MKLLIIKIFLFVLCLYIPLYFIQKIVDEGLRKYRNGEFSVWNDIYDRKVNADLLILGNSRALAHISPAILDSGLHLSSYNLGIDGADFNLTYTRFRVYMNTNKTPKVIILSLSAKDLEKGNGIFDPPQFMPFLSDTVIRRGTSGYQNGFGMYDLYVPAMKYCTRPEFFKIGFRLYFNKSVEIDAPRVRGYEGRERKWDNSFSDFVKSKKRFQPKLEDEIKKEFEEVVRICREKAIKLYFVYSPEYTKILEYFVNRDEVFSYFHHVSGINNIPFQDYSDDPISRDTAYFYNSEHLNRTGAEMFTRKLAADIKRLN